MARPFSPLKAEAAATFGFLTANIHVGVSRRLWLGVVDAAERLGVNLLCFPGGVLHSATNFESQRNALYDLAHPRLFDGVLNWASTIIGSSMEAGQTASDKHADATAFITRYRDLPMVNLTQPLQGALTVSVDSYQGMRAMMRHLLGDHGYRKVAFIRGPADHYYAQERYRAYLDALEEYAIPQMPELVTPHYAFMLEEGAAAIEELLDARGLKPGSDIEAIVAVSDLLALGALKALRGRGIAVPGEMALAGFNNSTEARLATPPLTTVDMPFHEQGARAMNALAGLYLRAEQPEHLMLHSTLVVRQSCGCPSRAIQSAAIGKLSDVADKHEHAVHALDEEQVAAIAQSLAAHILEDQDDAAQMQALYAAVVAAFADELHSGARRFLPALENALNHIAQGEGSIRRWQEVVSHIRALALPLLDHLARQRAENLFGQARVLIAEIAHRTQAIRQLQEERQSAILREIGQALITTFDIETLADELAARLPLLGIRSCYLALYESALPASAEAQPAWQAGPTGAPQQAVPESAQNTAPDTAQAQLVLAYTEEGRQRWQGDAPHFCLRELVPAHLLPRHRRYTMVVEPLFFRESRLGFVLFEVGPRDTAIYEVLRGYISSALKGALLVREAMLARATAEKADRIKTRLLANVSHELRTPLHIILENAAGALESWALPQELRGGMRHIQQSAEHQLQLINDLLDLSRAEIDELDLYPLLLDPRPLLDETFHSLAPVNFVQAGAEGLPIHWRFDVPARLPWILADPLRLRQILLNLLSNAQKFTSSGSITLGAEVLSAALAPAAMPAALHIWVQDTGAGIAPDQQERIFEPFVTGEQAQQGTRAGIGLGLSITRQLVALHHGSMKVTTGANSRAGAQDAGTTFHLYLPLPGLGDKHGALPPNAQSVLLVISSTERLPQEILDFSEQSGLALQQANAGADVESLLAGAQPAALAWDLVGATPGEWILLRRLRQHPHFAALPLIVYGHDPARAAAMSEGDAQEAARAGMAIGMTSFVAKPASIESLLDTMSAAMTASAGAEAKGCVLIVDDDAAIRARHSEVVARGLPGYVIRTAQDGAEATAIMQEETPSLVLLDLMMPGMDGADVLDWMRAQPQLRQVPVIVLSNRVLNFDDVRRLEHHAQVVLHSKGLLSEQETIETMRRVLHADSALPPYTSALAKHAVAFLHQNYGRPIARWELAEAVGVSEDYLARVFNRELGLSPWEYLNRYRIYQAKELLKQTSDGINAVARQVGFHDQRYFARVFRKITGMGPGEYREQG